MSAVIVAGFALAASAVIVTALAMAAMIITGFTLATGDTGVAAFVVTAFAMAAMIVAGFTFAASDLGVSALVVTAFAMAAMIVARFTLTASDAGVSASIIASLVMPVAAVITAAIKTHVLIAGPANHLVGALSARYGAARDALMDGPVMHASAATAHAHAGRTRPLAWLLPLERSVSPVATTVTAERTTSCFVFMRTSYKSSNADANRQR